MLKLIKLTLLHEEFIFPPLYFTMPTKLIRDRKRQTARFEAFAANALKSSQEVMVSQLSFG
jgi:hypothetical protein